MDGNGLTASDVALMSRDGDGLGNGWGGMIWLFAILAMMGGGFGYNGGGNANAIQADVNRGFDNQNLQAQTRDILTAVTAGTAQNVAAANQVYHDVVGYVGDKYSELQRDVAGLAVGQANLLARYNEVGCNTLRAIDGVNYNAAMNTAAINANTTAQIQKVLDIITGNRMAEMQDQINKLQLNEALAGVVRYPNSFAYNAGSNPFCGCGCNM